MTALSSKDLIADMYDLSRWNTSDLLIPALTFALPGSKGEKRSSSLRKRSVTSTTRAVLSLLKAFMSNVLYNGFRKVAVPPFLVIYESAGTSIHSFFPVTENVKCIGSCGLEPTMAFVLSLILETVDPKSMCLPKSSNGTSM